MDTSIKRISLGLSLISLALLQGCAGCTHACVLGFGPGNPAFNSMARAHDNPQSQPSRGYQSPLYITNTSGQTIGKISR